MFYFVFFGLRILCIKWYKFFLFLADGRILSLNFGPLEPRIYSGAPPGTLVTVVSAMLIDPQHPELFPVMVGDDPSMAFENQKLTGSKSSSRLIAPSGHNKNDNSHHSSHPGVTGLAQASLRSSRFSEISRLVPSTRPNLPHGIPSSVLSSRSITFGTDTSNQRSQSNPTATIFPKASRNPHEKLQPSSSLRSRHLMETAGASTRVIHVRPRGVPPANHASRANGTESLRVHKREQFRLPPRLQMMRQPARFPSRFKRQIPRRPKGGRVTSGLKGISGKGFRPGIPGKDDGKVHYSLQESTSTDYLHFTVDELSGNLSVRR